MLYNATIKVGPMQVPSPVRANTASFNTDSPIAADKKSAKILIITTATLDTLIRDLFDKSFFKNLYIKC